MNWLNGIGSATQIAGFFLSFSLATAAAGPELDRARKLYQLTDFEQSLKILQAIPAKDAAAWQLIGQNYYGQAEYKRASDALEKALALDSSSSAICLWLGRTYGRRAETSNPISAPMHASKARQFFERSVRLDPRNLEAESDLLEYYLEAPGFLGGGLDKAAATAARMAEVNPAEGYWALARIDEKRKQLGSAEEHLRRAIEAAPHQVGRVLGLARLLTKQGRYSEADQSLAQAVAMAPDSPKVIFGQAELYVQSKRNLPIARDLLKRYLILNLSPEDPPRSAAQKLLDQAQGI